MSEIVTKYKQNKKPEIKSENYIALIIIGYLILGGILQLFLSIEFSSFIAVFLTANIFYWIVPRDNKFIKKLGRSFRSFVILNVSLAIFCMSLVIVSPLLPIFPPIPETAMMILLILFLISILPITIYLVEKSNRK